MIKSITIQHFFSFGKSEKITLNPDTNILVGINGTGKSNFIKAIKLLYEGIAGAGLEKLMSEKWSGFESIINFSDSKIDRIGIEYCFDNNTFYFIQIINGNVKNGYGLTELIGDDDDSFKLIKTVTGTWRYSEKENGNFVNKYEGNIRNAAELLLRADTFISFDITNIQDLIESISIYENFDTRPESVLRQLSPYYSEKKLLTDGRNLAFLLSDLATNHIKAYDKIMEQFKKVNPQVRDLLFTTPLSGKTLLVLREKNLEKAITIEHISDGTLRFLLLLTIFYNPNRGKLICLDEPELGLHPDMINTIAEGIKYAAKDGTQMLIATHSPLLLNAFELEDLRIFEKNEDNQTVVKTVSEADFPDWQSEFLVGQMWLRGQIGGKRW